MERKKDTGERILGSMDLFIGESGEIAKNQVGLIAREPGLIIKVLCPGSEGQRVGEISFDCLQINAQNMGLLGSRFIKGTEYVHGLDEGSVFSLRLKTTSANGDEHILDCLTCKTTNKPKIVFSPDGHTKIPIVLDVLDSWSWKDIPNGE